MAVTLSLNSVSGIDADAGAGTSLAPAPAPVLRWAVAKSFRQRRGEQT